MHFLTSILLFSSVFYIQVFPVVSHSLSRVKRLIGGERVPNNEILYMLAMEIRDTFTCGASAISSNWAISAAHCLDKEDQPEDVTLWSDSKKIREGKKHRVERYVLHPKYERIVKNDISLVKVKDPFVVSNSLAFIQLIDPNYNLRENTELITAGWGGLSEGQYNDYLQKISINYVTNSRCKEIHRYYYTGFTLTNGMLCGYSAGRDITKGDSGGPLILRTGNGDRLVGINSYGVGEGKENGPGIFTRVSMYADWVNKVITGSIDSGPFGPGWIDNFGFSEDDNKFWRENGGTGDFWTNDDSKKFNDWGSFSNGNQFSNLDSNGKNIRDFLANIGKQFG